MTIQFGSDQWDKVEALLKGCRVALLSHPAAVDRVCRMTLEKALRSQSFEVVALWGAEHGFWGTHQDMEPVDHATDPWTGLPVLSLYQSEKGLRPPTESLKSIDAVLYDMQDVGARYYTFLHTLAYLIDTLHGTAIRLVVLDRPNPLGGVRLEGPILDPSLRSFVGSHPIPVRHALTPGEFARLYIAEQKRDVDIHIITLKNWQPEHLWPRLGRYWIPPSPNMPSFQTALVYPGLCLLEATNISEGRGTTRPFEWFGAPWLDPFQLAIRLNELRLPGVYFRPHVFRPMFGKHAGQICGGAQIHVTDASTFQPFWTGIQIMRIIHQLSGSRFSWRTDAYEFVTDRPAIDLLCGTSEFRERLEHQRSLEDLPEQWQQACQSWAEKVKPYLIYPRPLSCP